MIWWSEQDGAPDLSRVVPGQEVEYLERIGNGWERRIIYEVLAVESPKVRYRVHHSTRAGTGPFSAWHAVQDQEWSCWATPVYFDGLRGADARSAPRKLVTLAGVEWECAEIGGILVPLARGVPTFPPYLQGSSWRRFELVEIRQPGAPGTREFVVTSPAPTAPEGH